TRVHSRDLLCLRVVQFNLPATLIDRKQLRRRMAGTLFTERLSLILSNSSCDPNATFFIHREAVRVGLARPDGFITEVGRRLRWFGIAFTWRLRIADGQL